MFNEPADTAALMGLCSIWFDFYDCLYVIAITNCWKLLEKCSWYTENSNVYINAHVRQRSIIFHGLYFGIILQGTWRPVQTMLSVV